MKSRIGHPLATLGWQCALLAGILALWQFGWQLHQAVPWLVPNVLDPYFVSRPSDIWQHFLRLACFTNSNGQWNNLGDGSFNACMQKLENNIWIATAVTLRNTFFGFLTGVSSGFVLGLLLGRSDRLSAIFQPFLIAANSIPRIALAPIVILAFGIGDASKIVTAWMIVVFLVFFNTYEGARSVEHDHISVARLLGASEWQIMRTVIIPSTMAWLFASLTPAISFSLIGVIVGEFIGAEHGIGRMIIEAESRAEASGMMVAVIVLMIVGIILAHFVKRLQDHLLRWRPRSAGI